MKRYSVPSSLFFNNTATTEIYTLSLHDALPISGQFYRFHQALVEGKELPVTLRDSRASLELITALYHSAFTDRKSTRLNSSHANISYAVFCLKKKRN